MGDIFQLNRRFRRFDDANVSLIVNDVGNAFAAGIVQQQAAVDDAGFFTERVEDVADHGVVVVLPLVPPTAML